MIRFAVGLGRWQPRPELPGGADLCIDQTILFDNLTDAIDCRYGPWLKDESDGCLLVVNLFDRSEPLIVCFEGHMPGRFFNYYATLSDIMKGALGVIVTSSLAKLAHLASVKEKV